jgi:tellurium resistance protein TerD
MNDDFSNSDLDIPETEQPVYVASENLVHKGDYFDIRKKIPQLQQIAVGAGWDQKMFEEEAIDIDLSCFILNKADQTRDDGDFVFYNNDSACSSAVRHQGDSRTGAGDGDDEMVKIDLNGLPFDVVKLVFVLSIYDAAERDQSFDKVRQMYFRMLNMDDDNEVFRMVLPENEFTGHIGIKIGELVREGPKWFFNALCEPIPGGLAKIATQYGIIVANQG